MAKYISDKVKKLKVGISSFSENQTSLTVVGNVSVGGSITATEFIGDGSKLQGVLSSATIAVQNEGTTVGTSVTTLNFSGASVSVSNTVNGISTVTITASGITTYAPSSGVSTSVIGGIGSITQLRVSGVSTLGITSTTNLTSQQLNVSGLSTFAGITTITGVTLFSKQVNVSGASTFISGPVIIGSVSPTGTASQSLQVTGGAHMSGSVGFGTTNPREKIDIVGGNVSIQGISTSNRFYIQHNTSLNSLDFVFI